MKKGFAGEYQKVGYGNETGPQVLLQALETRVAEQQAKVKEAKARVRAAKQEYKQRRKAAKQAKRLLLEIEESLEGQHRVAAKAEKRYAKALKKSSATKEGEKSSPPRVSPRKPAKKVPTSFPVAAISNRKNHKAA